MYYQGAFRFSQFIRQLHVLRLKEVMTGLGKHIPVEVCMEMSASEHFT